MTNIKKATTNCVKELTELSIKSFIPAHGHAASKEIMDSYISKNFNTTNFIKEIENPKNEYYLIYHNTILAGYSKIQFNVPNKNIEAKNITKMERLYLLKEFYGLALAQKLFDFNVTLAKKNNQKGIWLYVWVENLRAISFYKKMGFKEIGYYDFELTPDVKKPNHVLFYEIL